MKADITQSPSFSGYRWSQNVFVLYQNGSTTFIVQLKIDKVGGKETNGFLWESQNIPIQFAIESQACIEWSKDLMDIVFWNDRVNLVPQKKSETYLKALIKEVCYNQQIFGTRCNHIIYNHSSLDNQAGHVREGLYPLELEYDRRIQNIARSHEDKDWYHPDFTSMRDAYIAMINMSSSDGMFLVTNIPQKDQSYGLYPKSSCYIILRRGLRCRDITVSVIHYEENKRGLMISGSNHVFSCFGTYKSFPSKSASIF